MSSSREHRPSVDAAFSRYLRSGVRSTCEAVAHLVRRGVSAETATRLVISETARGRLDDHAAIRLWAEHLVRQGYAASAIRQRLIAKGFEDRAIEQAVNRCAPAATEEARARLVAARRAKATGRQPNAARITRALAARGFDSEIIERVVSERFECESTESIN